MEDQSLWQTKLAAYVHDPVTKALILLRGVAHDQFSVAELMDELFPGARKGGIPAELAKSVKQADRWAAAADRVQLPMDKSLRVVFTRNPVLIHPISGQKFNLQTLQADEKLLPETIERLNVDHFKNLIVKGPDGVDYKRTFLAFWRLGPIPPDRHLGFLWQALPADTRSPDHSIWQHVSLTSAFAGALHAGGAEGAALFLVSFGPVQDFIAQARSVSDLWAGSHLLSTLAWQGIRVIAEKYGPDAVLFPSLLGIPLVDVWLRDEMGLHDLWPAQNSFLQRSSDMNPLFIAALPNRFLALVPAEEAPTLAREIGDRLKSWLIEQAQEVLEKLALEDSGFAARQVARQLEEFPEVNWAVVPWRLAGDSMSVLNDDLLREVLHQMGRERSYLDEKIEKVLKHDIKINGENFYKPNPGVAYPGLFELTERLHAAAKSSRTFMNVTEHGYRCSLCGEREWLTDNENSLFQSTGKRQDTVWTRLEKVSRVVKRGEHLCALCALKRFWPEIFSDWVNRHTSDATSGVKRYVISTQSMALARNFWRSNTGTSNEHHKKEEYDQAKAFLNTKIKEEKFGYSAALPYKLYRRLKKRPDDLKLYKQLPLLLERLNEREEESGSFIIQERDKVLNAIKTIFDDKPETYYALILMDGDRMGRWLAASFSDIPKLGDRFHPDIIDKLHGDMVDEYLKATRPSSPGWHQSISSALNDFAIGLSKIILEEIFMGKLIYSGGDDLLAMVAVHDLPGVMLALRCAFVGHLPLLDGSYAKTWEWLTCNTMPEDIDLRLQHGYALLKHKSENKLFQLMGKKATASIGAVVAHYKTPLNRVLRTLRVAEKMAKDQGNRDAFAITLMKRSGGVQSFIGDWRLGSGLKNGDMGLLFRLRNLLATQDLSRRASYAISEIVPALPMEKDAIQATLMREFTRHGLSNVIQEAAEIKKEAAELARSLAERACTINNSADWLMKMFNTAEFLARSGRTLCEKGMSHD